MFFFNLILAYIVYVTLLTYFFFIVNELLKTFHTICIMCILRTFKNKHWLTMNIWSWNPDVQCYDYFLIVWQCAVRANRSSLVVNILDKLCTYISIDSILKGQYNSVTLGPILASLLYWVKLLGVSKQKNSSLYICAIYLHTLIYLWKHTVPYYFIFRVLIF